MRFEAEDEPREIHARPRLDRDKRKESLADADLCGLALAEVRTLITKDKDLTQCRSVPHHGLLIVRLRQPDRHKIHRSVMHFIERFPENEWSDLSAVARDTTLSTSRSSGE